MGFELQKHLWPRKMNSHEMTVNRTNIFKLLNKTKYVFIIKSFNHFIYRFYFHTTHLRMSLSMGAALKVIPPILLYWPTTSKVDIGGAAVEVETSHQYSATFCCCATDGSRGAA